MSAPQPDPPGAVLYSRHGCSPCFAMRREAERSARRIGLPLCVVEIDGNADLEARYGREIPVLVLPGGETLRGRSAPGAVESAFRRAAAASTSVRRRPNPPGLATRRGGRLLSGLMSFLGWHRRPQA